MSTELTTKLTKKEVSEVLSYDPSTGEFVWLVNRRGGASAGNKAGTVKTGGYVQINVLGKMCYAHRLAWLFEHGDWPVNHIDHIDGDPSNNRICNLRDVPVSMNMENQKKAHISNKSCGLQGASFDKQTGRWSSKISVSNKTKNLGRYDSAQEAHSAYLSAKRALHQGATI